MEGSIPQIIASQNDRFRRGDRAIPGIFVLTVGVTGLLDDLRESVTAIVEVVREFDGFPDNNDPNLRRDFAQFEFKGQSCVWKIELYDSGLAFGSLAPADPTQTRRVLTIMLASEY